MGGLSERVRYPPYIWRALPYWLNKLPMFALKGLIFMAKILFTKKAIVDWHIYAATMVKTIYGYAMYGWRVTTSNINIKAKQNLNGWYTPEHIATLKEVANQKPPVWGFDCVNTTKGILWGWTGDESKDKGGAVHGSNGVPDTNADGMIQQCYDVSTDFSKIEIGEGLWLKGHWGLYIGNGLAVECTGRWKNGVQITAVHNIGKKAGYNGRLWTKHGKLPWVDYDGVLDDIHAEKIELGSRSLQKGMTGTDVIELQQDLMTLGYDLGSYGADGDYGSVTYSAVRQFQKDNGIAVSGTATLVTIDILNDLIKARMSVVKIEGGNCWIRTEPNSSTGKKIAVAKKGEVFGYLGKTTDNGWHLIEYNGGEGWVSGKYGKVV